MIAVSAASVVTALLKLRSANSMTAEHAMHPRAHQTLAAWQTFLATPMTERLRHDRCSTEQHVLTLLHNTVAEVPAYRHFLAAHGSDAGRVDNLAGYTTLSFVFLLFFVRAFLLVVRC